MCRIAHTAHRLGIATVGVYSDVDATSMHVDAVDIAVRLGGATAAESYLRGDAIIEAAQRTGADAIHPGYGFLAESADFAQAVIDAGLTWVGPQPRQIRLLGNKISAKIAAGQADVPTTPIVEVVPGRAPAGLTMPVLVKAASGGGGRGMRIVRQHIDVSDAIESASREADAAFGDDTVFIEPYIERGRHIEVQIIADGFGTVLHLGTRECSIQRRNQKIIEEAPAPNLADDVRESLIEGALSLARHIGYEGAGTVEFLLAGDGRVAFLEVNTRLQVEHPVTEAITGLDLVELQLLVADGKRLPISQEDVLFDGHSIEVRIVAEDPANQWLPDTGEVVHFQLGGDVRVDTGTRVGSVISPDYDSLLAKVISHEPTRHRAVAVMARSLRSSAIGGLKTNLAALTNIMSEPDFATGEVTTKYLDEHPAVTSSGLGDADHLAALVAAALAAEALEREGSPTGFAPSGWRNLRTQGQRRTWHESGADHPIEYTLESEAGVDTATVRIGPWPVPDDDGSMPPDERSRHYVRILSRPATADGQYAIEVDGLRTVQTVHVDGGVQVSSAAGHATFAPTPTFVLPESSSLGSGPNAPLPGTVIAVHVAEGDEVEEGQLLVVVEAMKMEHQIVSAGPAVVGEVRVAVGDRVNAGDLLVELAAVPS